MCSSDIFLAVLAVFFPPIAVWIKRGICTADSLINFALLILGYVPGLIHAWYIIVQYPEPDYDDPAYAPIPNDAENGRVTYYYISHQPAQRSYGTTDQQPQAPQALPAGAAGSSHGPSQGEARPPTYAEAVQGDHKIQTQD
ncbi:UPF0057-domain-containing protein [Penicillium chermesinum]|nr:UPF0057-domain-containing protein [Penicillium chermesinum]